MEGGGSESGARPASLLGKDLVDNIPWGRRGDRGGERERDGQREGVPSREREGVFREGERERVLTVGFMWETGRYCRLLVRGGERERDSGGCG